MKLCCLLLPNFPFRCETLRQPELAGRPAVVTYSVGSQKLVLDHSPGLKGVERAMPLQQALSRQRELAIVQADMAHYRGIFDIVLDRLEQVSPLVEGSVLGDIYIGCGGMERLYPDDRALVQVARQTVPADFEVRCGIADGKFLSRLMALNNSSDGFEKAAGDIAGLLKDMSCDLLPVSLKSKSRLHDFGLHTLGQLTALSRPQLEAQFGPEGGLIWKLARGRDNTPLYPRLSEETIEESTSLPSPVTSLEVLLLAVESLLIRAFGRFGTRGCGVRCIELWSRTSAAEYWQKTVHFKEPAMTVAAALRRVKQVIENCPQPGPVEELGMKVVRLGRPGGQQSSIFTEVRSSDKLESDIQQLELKMGAPQLFKVKEVEPWSRIPERRYTLTPLSR
ncbi:MAG: hypothetical protein P3T54_09250 [Dehalogenimonas sp.]|uniref:UmuC domain-containing protein n=1 Tax=Candidatus Dehalogenimonas loeffleri TaxID=3127115 RepID=A0ABZ2J258_9CHLR|nr:hypothetical protein [Dehalogenimonas sp.]